MGRKDVGRDDLIVQRNDCSASVKSSLLSSKTATTRALQAEIASINPKAPAAVVYTDGHPERLAAAEIARIACGSPEVQMTPGLAAQFVRECEVGEGKGGCGFFIALDADGTARKTLGSPGPWSMARISWEDAA
jgi:hypothetical protein